MRYYNFLKKYSKKKYFALSSIFFVFICISCEDDDTIICPELSFVSVVINDDNDAYRFVTNFEERDNIVYAWYLDGDPIQIEFGDDGLIPNFFDNTIIINNLSPGEHEICIRTRETGYCPDGVEYCETITVPTKEDCESIDFIIYGFQGIADTFEFVADFEAKDRVDYGWYINDVLIERESVSNPNRDHKLTYQFTDSGIVDICIRSLRPSCELSSARCKSLEVNL